MFLREDIVKFLNCVVNNGKENDLDLVKENIGKFRDYLDLTKLADSDTISRIDILVSCLEPFIELRDKIGEVDISGVFREEKLGSVGVQYRKERRISPVVEKHYQHYSHKTSSSCGSDSDSYSNSCGGGYVGRSC